MELEKKKNEPSTFQIHVDNCKGIYLWKPDKWTKPFIDEYIIKYVMEYNNLPTTTEPMYVIK